MGNSVRIQAIQAQVEKKGNKASDVSVLNRAKKAHDLTSDMLSYLSNMRETIIEKTGGRDEDGALKGAKDYDKQMAYTLGAEGAKNGAAYDLEKKLNEFVDQVNTLHDSLSFGKLAKPAS